ncbi:uncharacterized protein NPIL_408721 [Nephila pilipes]|uniref:Uncharacterized protein n=1 Tax=Nephila pilipes TaxID=299642 RepID=A0A8X6N0L4_NEPPI|nr:uncharacterized protein NPIL_408721 [Nephila pilipes]
MGTTSSITSRGGPFESAFLFQKSNQKELETSLKRRRLLEDDHPNGQTSTHDEDEDIEDSTPEYVDYFDSLNSRRPPKPKQRPPSTPLSTVRENATNDQQTKDDNDSSEKLQYGLELNPSQSEEGNIVLSNHKEPKQSEEVKPKERGSVKNVDDKEPEEGKHHGKALTGEEDIGNHQAIPGTTARPRKDPTNPNVWHKLETKGQIPPKLVSTSTERNNISEPTATPIEEECTPPEPYSFEKFLVMSLVGPSRTDRPKNS